MKLRHMVSIENAKAWIQESNKIVGFSGAGISTESGIPDFRSPNGIWAKNRTVYFQDFVENEEDRIEYWRQKSEMWPEMRQARPNAGHDFFVTLHQKKKLLGMITQNIEGLHQGAGLPNETVIELHGTMREVSCLSCGDRLPMDEACERIRKGDDAPECNRCGGFLKPATVSFGQSLAEEDLLNAARLCEQCELFIAVGSSLVVQPAASFPDMAKQNGAMLVIINRTETPLDAVADLVIYDEIGRTLASLL